MAKDMSQGSISGRTQTSSSGLSRQGTMSSFEDAFATLKRTQTWHSLKNFGGGFRDSIVKAGGSAKEKTIRIASTFWSDIQLNHSTGLQPKYRGKGLLLEGRFSFWSTKFLLLWDFFQIMGLYWITANPWPIPFPWVLWTQWWVYFNFDSFSASPGGALAGQTNDISISKWGSRDNYIQYAASFVITPVVLVLAFLFCTRIYFQRYAQAWDKHKAPALTVLLHALYLLYLPAGIATSRLFYCQRIVNPLDIKYGQWVLSCDQEETCGGANHTAALVLYCLMYVPLFLGLPYVFYTYVRDSIMYVHPSDHEKRLQAYEIASYLKIEDHYQTEQLWISAANTLSGAYYRVWVLGLKAALLVIYIGVRGIPSLGDDNSYKKEQAVLFWIVCSVFVARFVLCSGKHPPFRTSSDNMLFYLMCATLYCNVCFGLCNAWGVVNVVTVNSTQTLVLITFSFGSYFLSLLVLGLLGLNPYALWPAVRSIHRIEANKPFQEKVKMWVLTLNRGIRIRDEVIIAPPEVADAQALQKAIRDLRSCWLEARSRGSIFELILGDTVEELLYVYASRLDRLHRLNDGWNAAYTDAVKDGLWRKRESHYILTTSRKRSILSKLFALRMLQQREPEADLDVVGVMRDPEMKKALRAVSSLEKKTILLLQEGEDYFSQVRFRGADIAVQGNTVGREEGVLLEPTEKEQRHVDAVEEALHMWENIIITVEDAQAEHPFTRRLFTSNRMEDWYTNRETLVTHLAELNRRFGYTYDYVHEEEERDEMFRKEGEQDMDPDMDPELFGVFIEAAHDFKDSFFTK